MEHVEDVFGSSFYFAGSTLSERIKSLSVSLVSKMTSKKLQEHFQQFMQAGESSKSFEKEPFFAGFYLLNTDYSLPLFSDIQMLLCKLAPVFIHLCETSVGCKYIECPNILVF
jgi:hypothetical protein